MDNKACFPPESFRLSASLLLSVSVPVSQVSVSANRSSCWSMMKSWRVVVLLQTDHGLSVQNAHLVCMYNVGFNHGTLSKVRSV